MREMNFLRDRLLIAILVKRPLAQLGTARSSWDKCMWHSPDVFAAQTYDYELGGFVRANSGQGTIHRSGT